MQPNPYLSVAIPTYNREVELTQCLKSIVPQACEHGIRIYISDNASSYDVRSLVERFRSGYPWIFYHRNERNLGLDANVRQVISMVESKYAWLFSDDDVMVADALALILPLCRLGKYQLIMPDREYKTRDLSQPVEKWESLNHVVTPTEFTDPVELLVRYCHLNYTFIGCLIIDLSAWRRVDGTSYISCKWFEHLCILAEMMLSGKALVLPDRLLIVRSENTSWAGDWRVWAYNFPRALTKLPPAYPLKSRRQVLSGWLRLVKGTAFRLMMSGRLRGALNWQNRESILAVYRDLQAYNWIVAAYLALLMPERVAHLLKRLGA